MEKYLFKSNIFAQLSEIVEADSEKEVWNKIRNRTSFEIKQKALQVYPASIEIRKIKEKKEKSMENNTVTLDDGITINTVIEETEDNFNVLQVEAGSTGKCGGDSGHGCRTYFRIEDVASTDMTINKIADRFGFVSGFEVILGGDSELDSIIEALKFIVDALEIAKKNS